jgi:hypothetical protein
MCGHDGHTPRRLLDTRDLVGIPRAPAFRGEPQDLHFLFHYSSIMDVAGRSLVTIRCCVVIEPSYEVEL